MFDLGWSEMLIIAVVAIVVVGPKDLPKMLRGLGRFVGQAKRMAGEFTGHFQDALRDSELDELKKEFDQAASADPLADVQNELNKDFRELDDDLKKTVSDFDRADDAENAAYEAELAANDAVNGAANENDVSDEGAVAGEDEPSVDPEPRKMAVGDDKGA